jgi:hypothetical protein
MPLPVELFELQQLIADVGVREEMFPNGEACIDEAILHRVRRTGGTRLLRIHLDHILGAHGTLDGLLPHVEGLDAERKLDVTPCHAVVVRLDVLAKVVRPEMARLLCREHLEPAAHAQEHLPPRGEDLLPRAGADVRGDLRDSEYG